MLINWIKKMISFFVPPSTESSAYIRYQSRYIGKNLVFVHISDNAKLLLERKIAEGTVTIRVDCLTALTDQVYSLECQVIEEEIGGLVVRVYCVNSEVKKALTDLNSKLSLGVYII